MQKFSDKVCFIILLVLVAASCMAQAAPIETADGGSDGARQHLIKKRVNLIPNTYLGGKPIQIVPAQAPGILAAPPCTPGTCLSCASQAAANTCAKQAAALKAQVAADVKCQKDSNGRCVYSTRAPVCQDANLVVVDCSKIGYNGPVGGGDSSNSLVDGLAAVAEFFGTVKKGKK